METGNAKLVSQAYEAFARRDVAAVMALVDPQIEVRQTELLPWGGTYTGTQGLLGFFTRLLSHVDSRVEVEEYIEAGEQVIAIGYTRGEVRQSGRHFDVRLAHVWTVKDGKLARFEPYVDTPRMLEALAL
ncbi:MAG: nuclear transport factor 2 family protein [Acidobacteria bacterium]|nr:nuclear transport factor 2 family protein [Acidobacteriota bacterium]